MRKLWPLAIPTLLAVVALGVVLLQTREIRKLREEVRRARRAPSDGLGDPEATSDLRRRVLALENTSRRLLALLYANKGSLKGKIAAGSDASLPAAWLKGRISNLRQDVDGLLTGRVISTAEGRKRLLALARRAQAEARAERRRRKQAWRDQRLQHKLTKLAESANLSDSQVADMKNLLTAERSARRRVKEEMRAGRTPFDVGRAERRQLRRKTDQAVERLLDRDQYDAYRRTIRRKRWKRRG